MSLGHPGSKGEPGWWASVFAVMPGNGSHFKKNDPETGYIANFDVFGAPYAMSGGSGDWDQGYLITLPWNNASTVVSECALWACVQKYNVSVSSGQQMESVVSNYAKILPFSIDDAENFTFVSIPSDQPGENTVPYNFTLQWAAVLGLQVYLSQMMNGTVDLGSSHSIPSSAAIQAIWGASADLKDWIKNLATSMTHVVRTTVPTSRSEFNGTSYQLGVRVHWEWLALLAATVLASFLFLVVVIVKTARSRVQPWKGSPSVFLLCEVDQEARQDATGAALEYKRIEEAIGKRRAVLDQLPDGQ
jgi:hypothetical protein